VDWYDLRVCWHWTLRLLQALACGLSSHCFIGQPLLREERHVTIRDEQAFRPSKCACVGYQQRPEYPQHHM
jgi:hypothetical protein